MSEGARGSKQPFSTLDLVRCCLRSDEQDRLRELEVAASEVQAELTADERLRIVEQLSRGLLELIVGREQGRGDGMWEALALVDAVPQPWDEPGWSCCADPDCPFVAKCLDTERLDAAWLLLHPPERDA